MAIVAIVSPLHYPMLWNDWVAERRTAKSLEVVYQGNSVFVWLPTGFGKSICCQYLPFVIEYKKGQLVLCLTKFAALVAVWVFFCLIHTRYFFTTRHSSSVLRHFVVTGATSVWNWRAFIIRLIPGSPLADWRTWERG